WSTTRRWLTAMPLIAMLAACNEPAHPSTVAAAELVREYETSGDAADIRYAERPVRVHGAIGIVGTSPRGRTIVRFRSQGGSLLSVVAVMADQPQTPIRAGADAVLTCQSLIRRFNIILRGCRAG